MKASEASRFMAKLILKKNVKKPFKPDTLYPKHQAYDIFKFVITAII